MTQFLPAELTVLRTIHGWPTRPFPIP